MPRAPLVAALRRSLLLAPLLTLGLSAQTLPPRKVILVTLDGVRIQELFGGMDSVVSAIDSLSGIARIERVRTDYWRTTAEARRRALMPFFWDSLVTQGVLFGNPARHSRVTIANSHGFSAPGYLELLTGEPQADVTSNDRIRYDHETVLQYARRRLRLPQDQVAVFASWENFREYAASRSDAVLVNAGFDSLPATLATPEMRRLALLQSRALPLWDGSRLDAFTGAMALAYLRRHQPRLLYVAMNDSDDLAHSRRYDRVLDALHALDGFLRELWQTAQSLPGYRGRTTLIITTDHGRGVTPDDWTDHGEKVAGSTDIWLAVIGPDTPHDGELADRAELKQGSVAGTVLACLGLDPAEWKSTGAPPVPGACARR